MIIAIIWDLFIALFLTNNNNNNNNNSNIDNNNGNFIEFFYILTTADLAIQGNFIIGYLIYYMIGK